MYFGFLLVKTDCPEPSLKVLLATFILDSGIEFI